MNLSRSLVFAQPAAANDSELCGCGNFLLAMPTVTPSWIEPEWYFLPFYAVLRAVACIGAVPEFHGCMMIDLAAYTVGARFESGQWWHEFLGLHAVWYDLLVGPLWILAGALLRALIASVSMVRLAERSSAI